MFWVSYLLYQKCKLLLKICTTKCAHNFSGSNTYLIKFTIRANRWFSNKFRAFRYCTYSLLFRCFDVLNLLTKESRLILVNKLILCTIYLQIMTSNSLATRWRLMAGRLARQLEVALQSHVNELASLGEGAGFSSWIGCLRSCRHLWNASRIPIVVMMLIYLHLFFSCLFTFNSSKLILWETHYAL